MKRRSVRFVFFMVFPVFALWLTAEAGYAAMVHFPVPGGPWITKSVVTMKEARFTNVVPQKADFSCGAAALATLLTFQFGKDVTEEDVITGMFEYGDKNLIRERGFSLLEMKSYAKTLGYAAGGYKLEAEQLKKINFPAIMLINIRGYSHFVVYKGTLEDKVHLADPAWGNRVMDLKSFSNMWNNITFVLDGPIEGTPVGLAAVETPSWGAKSHVPRAERRFRDSFALDNSTPQVTGSYPWWR